MMSLRVAKQPNRLKALRAERAATQWDVADATGIAHWRYWKIEAGRAEPTPQERRALCRAMGVTHADIWPAA
jgi:DNA-binding XRE family transcriptional regulator